MSTWDIINGFEYTEAAPKPIRAFVANMLLYESGGADYMDPEAAAYNLECWAADGVEIPEGATPWVIASEWNRQLELDLLD